MKNFYIANLEVHLKLHSEAIVTFRLRTRFVEEVREKEGRTLACLITCYTPTPVTLHKITSYLKNLVTSIPSTTWN